MVKKSTNPKAKAPKTKTRYFKVLAPKNKHWGMTYKTNAWNTDILPYNPEGECQEGGLYFAPVKHIFTFLHYGNGIAEVLDYKDDKGKKKFHKEELKMKAHSIKLGAKKNFSLKFFKELVKEGALLDSTDKLNVSPVHHLLKRGRTDIAEMLLELGADPTDHDTHDILESVVRKAHSQHITLILNYYTPEQFQSYINSPNGYYIKELLYASYENHDIIPEHLKHIEVI